MTQISLQQQTKNLLSQSGLFLVNEISNPPSHQKEPFSFFLSEMLGNGLKRMKNIFFEFCVFELWSFIFNHLATKKIRSQKIRYIPKRIF